MCANADHGEMQKDPVSRPTEVDEIRLLHVDDDAAFAETAAAFLERASEPLAVTVETDPVVAAERVVGGDTRFDCVLADYDMPDVDGLELLERLRERGSTVPFILFTGKGSEAIASRAVSAGVTDYIQKERGTEQYAVVANRIVEAVTQERAERKLDRTERYYRRLVESAPTPITMYDCEGRYVYVNREAASFFGAESQADVVGGTKFDFVSPAEHADLETRLGRLADGDRVPPSEHAYRTLNGQRRTGVASCAPAVFHDDAVGVTIVRETTARQGPDSPLEEIAKVLSHDIRSPLTVAEGRIELARQTGDVDDLDVASDSLDRIRRLVEDVVDVLRQEGLDIEPEPVDLCALVHHVWGRLAADAATLRVETDLRLEADESSLDRALENLFRNAIEHAGPDVTVTVGDYDEGFYVADDGPGIDPERREEVFVPGETTGAGSGLGLVSVRQVAQSHGWTVTCTGSQSGGVRFEFALGRE